MQLIILTGLSGSGKSVALKALEDSAYYTSDNLPALLLPALVDFLNHAGYGRVAVSIDARSGDTLSQLPRQVRDLKARFPHLCFVGSGYTYLQEFLPYVAQAVVRAGWTDLVGLGRMMLSYPEMVADVLSGRTLQRKRLCRTFSDCTTAPRNGMISGCFPLDTHYKKSPQMAHLTLIKKAAKLA